MVYLLHFDEKLAHAQHYIGFAKGDTMKAAERRLKVHRSGRRPQAARILCVLNEKGIGYHIARIWPAGTKQFERLLKNRKKAAALCPVCRNQRHRHDPNQLNLNF